MCRECRKQLGSEYAVVLGGHAQLARHACDFRIVVVVVSTQEVLFVEQLNSFWFCVFPQGAQMEKVFSILIMTKLISHE